MKDLEKLENITKALARLLYWTERTNAAILSNESPFVPYNIGAGYACELEKEKLRAGWEFCEHLNWAQVMKSARKMASDQRKQEIKRGEY